MEMTKNEILRDWEGAKDKKAQIQILADLNQTSQEEIKNILIEMGVDYRRLPREREKKNEKAAEAPKAQPKEGTIDDIIRDWEEEKGKKKQDQEAQPKLLRAKDLETKPLAYKEQKFGKPTVEPRRKHTLRRMEELFQAIVTQEMVDETPDREWADEFIELWDKLYRTHWRKQWGEQDD